MNAARRKRLVILFAVGLCVAPGHTLLRLLAVLLEALGAVTASKRLREKAMEGCEAAAAEGEEG